MNKLKTTLISAVASAMMLINGCGDTGVEQTPGTEQPGKGYKYEGLGSSLNDVAWAPAAGNDSQAVVAVWLNRYHNGLRVQAETMRSVAGVSAAIQAGENALMNWGLRSSDAIVNRERATDTYGVMQTTITGTGGLNTALLKAYTDAKFIASHSITRPDYNKTAQFTALLRQVKSSGILGGTPIADETKPESLVQALTDRISRANKTLGTTEDGTTWQGRAGVIQQLGDFKEYEAGIDDRAYLGFVLDENARSSIVKNQAYAETEATR